MQCNTNLSNRSRNGEIQQRTMMISLIHATLFLGLIGCVFSQKDDRTYRCNHIDLPDMTPRTFAVFVNEPVSSVYFEFCRVAGRAVVAAR